MIVSGIPNHMIKTKRIKLNLQKHGLLGLNQMLKNVEFMNQIKMEKLSKN